MVHEGDSLRLVVQNDGSIDQSMIETCLRAAIREIRGESRAIGLW